MVKTDLLLLYLPCQFSPTACFPPFPTVTGKNKRRMISQQLPEKKNIFERITPSRTALGGPRPLPSFFHATGERVVVF